MTDEVSILDDARCLTHLPPLNGFSLPFSHGRHKTDMTSLREMMPADMLQYCQEHGLLDAMLQEATPAATVAPATASRDKSGPA
jgi:hypothetical protein